MAETGPETHGQGGRWGMPQFGAPQGREGTLPGRKEGRSLLPEEQAYSAPKKPIIGGSSKGN